MRDGRDAVLTAIRAALGRSANEANREVAPPARHVRPAVSDDLTERFQRKLESRAATVERLGSAHEVPGTVARYLQKWNMASRVVCAPSLAMLPWPKGSFDLHVGPARRDERVSITSCFAGVAETGSLVLLSTAATPTTLNFVPEHHLVVIRRDQIVRHFEDAWERLRRWNAENGMPRTVNVISGPSRTADIEQTIQLGAHGPRHVHVMIAEK